MARLEGRLGVTVQTSWGMTELSPSGVFARPNDPHRAAARSGRPAVGVDLLLTDAEGRPLPDQRDAEGHLKVKGPAVVRRYFGEAAPATDDDGWFPTGDLARIEATGELVITGRAKDLIKSGGEWINPAEIEAVVQGEGRNTSFDALCASIGAVISADRTLGGRCDWVEAEAPRPVDLPIEGAASLKAAVIPIILHYSTADPLA